MAARNSKNKEYYAVIEGYLLSEPTIYSSWAKAHLRVTGYKPWFKGFFTLDEAKAWMESNGCHDYVYDIASEHENTTPRKNEQAYYAVADGDKPGVYSYFLSRGGAQEVTDKYPGNCHKHFRTEEQARQFIKDFLTTRNELFLQTISEPIRSGQRHVRRGGPRELRRQANDWRVKDLADLFEEMFLQDCSKDEIKDEIKDEK